MLWNEDQPPRVKKERKRTLRGMWESVFRGRHLDNVPKETHVVSVMTQAKPLGTAAKVRDEKDDRLLLHPIRRRNRLTARNTSPQRDQAKERNALWTRVKFHADSNSVKTRHASFWYLPVATNVVSDMLRLKERPAKSQRKVVPKDQLPYLKESLGCVSRDICPRKSILREQFSKGTWHHIQIGKARVHREELSKSARLMSVVLAHQNSGKDHMRRTCTKKDAPAKQRGIWRKTFRSSRIRTELRSFLQWKQRRCRHLLQRDQRSANS